MRQQVIHDTAVAKGFWDGPVDINVVLAKLCLIHSEVSEVMEAIRKERPNVLEEFADVVIRLEDLVEGMYLAGWLESNDLEGAITDKMLVNSTRPHKHGNLI